MTVKIYRMNSKYHWVAIGGPRNIVMGRSPAIGYATPTLCADSLARFRTELQGATVVIEKERP